MKMNKITPSGAFGSAAYLLFCAIALSAVSFGQTSAQWLTQHNNYRRVITAFDGGPTSSPDFIWSDALANDAQEWATKMSASGEFKHRPNSSNSSSTDARAWGENLAWGSSATYNGLEGLTAWYNEKPFFLPVTSRCSAGNVCGHYTQVISQLSREVGCATASGPNGVYAVCNYTPHGNDTSNGGYADLYPNQRAPVPGGAAFGNLKNELNLDFSYSECLKTVADGLLAASVPTTAGNPADLAPACNFMKVRSYDTGVMSAYTGAPDSAAATFINYNFQNKVLGTNGAVAFSLNPARAVLVTGE